MSPSHGYQFGIVDAKPITLGLPQKGPQTQLEGSQCRRCQLPSIQQQGRGCLPRPLWQPWSRVSIRGNKTAHCQRIRSLCQNRSPFRLSLSLTVGPRQVLEGVQLTDPGPPPQGTIRDMRTWTCRRRNGRCQPRCEACPHVTGAHLPQ